VQTGWLASITAASYSRRWGRGSVDDIKMSWASVKLIATLDIHD